MKVLLDSCIWGGAAVALAAAGHDVQWAGELPKDPGDEALLRQAASENRVMVTLDKDFGELAIVRGVPHAGIVRLVGVSAREQGPVCVHVLERYGQELASGAIATVDPGRVRLRPRD
jgi:predicted nuclease of predicted toxin-antitoxin system